MTSADGDLNAFRGPIARLRSREGEVKGAGFLVGERHVMTCAHVVDEALGRNRGTEAKPTMQVHLDLPFLGQRSLRAEVVAWQPARALEMLEDHPVSDVAVLELPEPIQGGLDSSAVCLSIPASNKPFVTFGFPEGLDNGASAEGKFLMTDAGGWAHVRDTQSLGYFIQPGFSGAPVFEAGSRRLMGMVAAADADTDRRLGFVIPAIKLGWAWPLLVRPYKGLFAFAEDDANIMFGRDSFIKELAAKVEAHAFLTVIGPSGSGKSSVVMAGLVPHLRTQGRWAVAECRPLQSPLYLLALAIESLAHGDFEERASRLEERLRREPSHVLDRVDAIRRSLPGVDRVMLVVDQFEELFTLDNVLPKAEATAKANGVGLMNAPDNAGAAEFRITNRQREFVAVLAAIGRQRGHDARLKVVTTLRADFTGRALGDRLLADLMRDADVKLGPMTSAELIEAIERPAALFGVEFEAGLVAEMVAAMLDKAGGLPLLQFALDRLWRCQEGR